MRELPTKQQLLADKEEVLKMKKLTVKTADSFVTPSEPSEAIKTFTTKNRDEKTIVGNTYYWMDSHNDVHVSGCFKKTIKENANNIFHLHDHDYKITSKVGKPQRIYEEKVAWKDLGVNKSGMTEALFMDTKIMKDWNPRIYKAYIDGEINQHSVGMVYVKIEAAINDENDSDAYKLWNEFYPKIANKERADEMGYFFVVKEAKLREISCVLLGSNSITPTMKEEDVETEEPLQDTLQQDEPLANTQAVEEPTLEDLMSQVL